MPKRPKLKKTTASPKRRDTIHPQLSPAPAGRGKFPLPGGRIKAYFKRARDIGDEKQPPPPEVTDSDRGHEAAAPTAEYPKQRLLLARQKTRVVMLPPRRREPATAEPAELAALTVSVAELCTAYREDAARADDIYGERLLEVTGHADTITSQSHYAVTTCTLKCPEAELFCAVYCHFPRSRRPRLPQMLVGRETKIRGICGGYTINVRLRECELVG